MGGTLGGHPQGSPRCGKKSRKYRFFLFDLRKSRPYNPRPRCFASDGYEVVLPVEFRREIRRRALFDIVILGRGTWAAARYATTPRVKPWCVNNRAAT
jgi:hypothetical protein